MLAPFITDDAVKALEDMIQTMPMAAEQVLKYATNSPFSALGIERLQQARVLNTVNKRALLKNYRRLALQLHPDKCDHEMVSLCACLHTRSDMQSHDTGCAAQQPATHTPLGDPSRCLVCAAPRLWMGCKR